MSFRQVPKATLDDLERRNSHIRILISPNQVAFEADYVKVVEDTPVLTAAEMQSTESSLQRYIIYGDIGRGHFSERDQVRHSALAGENLTNNQP